MKKLKKIMLVMIVPGFLLTSCDGGDHKMPDPGKNDTVNVSPEFIGFKSNYELFNGYYTHMETITISATSLKEAEKKIRETNEKIVNDIKSEYNVSKEQFETKTLKVPDLSCYGSNEKYTFQFFIYRNYLSGELPAEKLRPIITLNFYCSTDVDEVQFPTCLYSVHPESNVSSDCKAILKDTKKQYFYKIAGSNLPFNKDVNLYKYHLGDANLLLFDINSTIIKNNEDVEKSFFKTVVKEITYES